MSRLDKSTWVQVKKAIDKVLNNPLPHVADGFGEPLGNKQSKKLTGLYKIKLKAIGIRIVYAVIEVEATMLVVVVGARADGEVYDDAAKRRDKYGF